MDYSCQLPLIIIGTLAIYISLVLIFHGYIVLILQAKFRFVDLLEVPKFQLKGF